jgi:hypothetical protein
MPLGSPGMQVKSLVPWRRIVMFPLLSISATVASFPISGGATERARAIWVSFDCRCLRMFDNDSKCRVKSRQKLRDLQH